MAPRAIRWSNLLYWTLSGALILIAVLLILAAFWNVVAVVMARGDVLDALLQAVGLIVIAMAATDVGKYLFEEEVERDRELRSATEARRSLTKFMVIICIAVALEGVVQIFRATTGPLEALFGAALLVLTSVAVMIGLGVYQRLSREVETEDTREPPSDAAAAE